MGGKTRRRTFLDDTHGIDSMRIVRSTVRKSRSYSVVLVLARLLILLFFSSSHEVRRRHISPSHSCALGGAFSEDYTGSSELSTLSLSLSFF